MDLSILSWNVRGLNHPAKRRAVQIFVSDLKCNVVCLQETKISDLTNGLVVETLGPKFRENFIFLPAAGSRGGILIACSDDFEIAAVPLAVGVHSVSGTVRCKADGATWSITGVYGPQLEEEKIMFIDEMKNLRQLMLPRWMLLGDFNMIYRANDKSNNSLNLGMMGRFRAAIEDMELIDYPLLGRRFTWSNERQNVTHTKIDRILVSSDWEASYPQYQLSPASTNISDHCPIILRKMECSHYKAFRFENHWLKYHDFDNIVSQAWIKEVNSNDPVRVLHCKLSRTARALRLWNKQKTRWAVFMSGIASEIIFRLDLAQEERTLSDEERRLRGLLKAKLLGLAAIDRSRWRQKSRLTEIKEGDASTRFFHLRASGRRRKNHIPSLKGSAGMVNDHEGKAKILLNRFKGLMGTPFSSSAKLNWESIGFPRRDLQHLDAPFTEQELKAAVNEVHGEKAPGPDGFTGAFFKRCWLIIKDDLLAAVNCVHSLRGQNWHLLNTANIVLLPKRDGAQEASDFRPISLMHTVPKLVSKMMVSRLAQEIHWLVTNNQSAFIRGRAIQDNFLYVKNVIKAAHSAKSPLVFLKLDMAKAFDSVGWGYLLEVMEAMGFGQRWRDMVSLIWSSSSSRVLLNGSPGTPFIHRRGLRQGDPLSLLLFIIAMEPLQRLFWLATERGILYL